MWYISLVNWFYRYIIKTLKLNIIIEWNIKACYLLHLRGENFNGKIILKQTDILNNMTFETMFMQIIVYFKIADLIGILLAQFSKQSDTLA